jgi:hypothetical protein
LLFAKVHQIPESTCSTRIAWKHRTKLHLEMERL